MRYANLKFNDIANAPGVSVSFFTQGCPHHCFNCFNKETWDFNGGKEFTQDTLNSIIYGLTANGVQRNLCILGGEPLCDNNCFLTYLIIKTVKEKAPNTPIYIWTGYTLSTLLEQKNPTVLHILQLSDFLIDGPYIDALHDYTLSLRGSSNQCIYNKNDLLKLI